MCRLSTNAVEHESARPGLHTFLQAGQWLWLWKAQASPWSVRHEPQHGVCQQSSYILQAERMLGTASLEGWQQALRWA